MNKCPVSLIGFLDAASLTQPVREEFPDLGPGYGDRTQTLIFRRRSTLGSGGLSREDKVEITRIALAYTLGQSGMPRNDRGRDNRPIAAACAKTAKRAATKKYNLSMAM